jgi:hypothetical protein
VETAAEAVSDTRSTAFSSLRLDYALERSPLINLDMKRWALGTEEDKSLRLEDAEELGRGRYAGVEVQLAHDPREAHLRLDCYYIASRSCQEADGPRVLLGL